MVLRSTGKGITVGPTSIYTALIIWPICFFPEGLNKTTLIPKPLSFPPEALLWQCGWLKELFASAFSSMSLLSLQFFYISYRIFCFSSNTDRPSDWVAKAQPGHILGEENIYQKTDMKVMPLLTTSVTGLISSFIMCLLPPSSYKLIQIHSKNQWLSGKQII